MTIVVSSVPSSSSSPPSSSSPGPSSTSSRPSFLSTPSSATISSSSSVRYNNSLRRNHSHHQSLHHYNRRHHNQSVTASLYSEGRTLRIRRQDSADKKEADEAEAEEKRLPQTEGTCEFGTGPEVELCNWWTPPDSHPNVRWRAGYGSTAYWLGGPLIDKTSGDDSGMLAWLLFAVHPSPPHPLSCSWSPELECPQVQSCSHQLKVKRAISDMISSSPRLMSFLMIKSLGVKHGILDLNLIHVFIQKSLTLSFFLFPDPLNALILTVDYRRMTDWLTDCCSFWFLDFSWEWITDDRPLFRVHDDDRHDLGGYVYFETSYKAVNRVFSSAALESGSGELRLIVPPPGLINDPSHDRNFTIFHPSASSSSGEHRDEGRREGSRSGKLTSASSMISASSASREVSGGGSSSGHVPIIFKQPYSVAQLDPEPIILGPSHSIAHLYSPNITVTGPQGYCLSFSYNMDGLSAERMRILVKDISSNLNQTLWETSESNGNWTQASVSYAYETVHQVHIHVSPLDYVIHRLKSHFEFLSSVNLSLLLASLNFRVERNSPIHMMLLIYSCLCTLLIRERWWRMLKRLLKQTWVTSDAA